MEQSREIPSHIWSSSSLSLSERILLRKRLSYFIHRNVQVQFALQFRTPPLLRNAFHPLLQLRILMRSTVAPNACQVKPALVLSPVQQVGLHI